MLKLLYPRDIGFYFVVLLWLHIAALALTAAGVVKFDWMRIGILYPVVYLANVFCGAFAGRRSAG